MSKATGFQLLAILFFVSQIAFAEPRVRYVPTNEIKLAKTDASSLPILTARPERRHVVLGRWWGSGDTSSTQENLLMLAREKAAELGADFIVIAKQQMVTHRQRGRPSGGFGMEFGAGTISSAPLLNATFGVFAKATTGVQYRGPMVAGFSDNSAAPSAGVLVGDEILQIDGVPLSSERMPERILEKVPGQVVRLLVKRGDATLTIPVPLVAND